MAIEYLKRGKPEADRAEDDAKTAAIVSATLKDIEERGDSAVRELACKFDNYDRDTYRLSHNEIQAIIARCRVYPLCLSHYGKTSYCLGSCIAHLRLTYRKKRELWLPSNWHIRSV